MHIVSYMSGRSKASDSDCVMNSHLFTPLDFTCVGDLCFHSSWLVFPSRQLLNLIRVCILTLLLNKTNYACIHANILFANKFVHACNNACLFLEHNVVTLKENACALMLCSFCVMKPHNVEKDEISDKCVHTYFDIMYVPVHGIEAIHTWTLFVHLRLTQFHYVPFCCRFAIIHTP